MVQNKLLLGFLLLCQGTTAQFHFLHYKMPIGYTNFVLRIFDDNEPWLKIPLDFGKFNITFLESIKGDEPTSYMERETVVLSLESFKLQYCSTNIGSMLIDLTSSRLSIEDATYDKKGYAEIYKHVVTTKQGETALDIKYHSVAKNWIVIGQPMNVETETLTEIKFPHDKKSQPAQPASQASSQPARPVYECKGRIKL
mgnify:CR=1 FL=1